MYYRINDISYNIGVSIFIINFLNLRVSISLKNHPIVLKVILIFIWTTSACTVYKNYI